MPPSSVHSLHRLIFIKHECDHIPSPFRAVTGFSLMTQPSIQSSIFISHLYFVRPGHTICPLSFFPFPCMTLSAQNAFHLVCLVLRHNSSIRSSNSFAGFFFFFPSRQSRLYFSLCFRTLCIYFFFSSYLITFGFFPSTY